MTSFAPRGRLLPVLCAVQALLLLLLAAWPASAQRRQNCELVYAGTTNSFGVNTPNQIDFLGGGVTLRCDGGTTIRSDSAVNTTINSRLEFVGRVRYADTLRTLTADYLQYLGQERLIVANNNVVLTDLRNGSTLEGPFLSYYLQTETRPEEILQMPQGRPRATLVRPVAEDTTRSDTTTVVANMIEIIGEDRFVGRGNVEIARADLDAYGGQVVFQEQSGVLNLTSAARVETEQYTLQGDTIVATGPPGGGGGFEEIDARLGAHLISDELDVSGLRIRVFLANDELDRLVAVGDTARVTRAVATSPDFRLEADSIDALAPAQRLETVHAYGAAYGERITPDSLAADRPELIRNDWVRGDTIIAQFTDAPPAEVPADSTAPERVLERLDAIAGAEGLASSLYRMPDRQGEPGSYAVNYMLARRIAVLLNGGEVTSVEAEEQVHGIYLRPPNAGRPPENATPPGGTGSR